MARKYLVPNPNPLSDKRSMLEVPEQVKFRRRAPMETDGRGNSWQKGNLHGWEGDAMIVFAREYGGWRTLMPELWEWKSA